jgi:chemotaxis protein histidine kinase CheA
MLSKVEVSSVLNNMMNGMMYGMLQKTATSIVEECARKYGFSAEEALMHLGVAEMRIVVSKKEKQEKLESKKPSFPLPYNGEYSEMLCQALRQNNGLYTQCQGKQKMNGYCKSCHELSKKSESGIPEYGTITERRKVGIYEYIDPKGRKPISYTKIMNKYKVSAEDVKLEASKFNIIICEEHFVAPEEPKRGRKPSGEPKEANGSKGRPKKTSKVIQLAEDDEDLFASLVASANVVDDEIEEENIANKLALEEEKAAKKLALEEEKAAKKLALEEEKAAKKLALEEEKASKKLALEQEKEAKKLALEQEKEAKKAALEQEKEAKKLALEQEKEAKKAALEQEKEAKKAALEQEKEAKKAALEQEKAAKKSAKNAEEETYKKCGEVDGVKYIRSQQTNIVYNLNIYKDTEELHAVGKWDAEKKEIIFTNSESSDTEDDE